MYEVVKDQINQYINKYNYRKLPEQEGKWAREFYRLNVPEWCIKPSQSLYTKEWTKFTIGFTRLVIGDYGPFIEFSKEQIRREVIQKTDIDRLSIWKYTVKDKSNIRINYIKRKVDYINYKLEMFYVSPFEVEVRGD